MTDTAPDICRWCGHTRPDHDETCPVRKFAEGIARTMSSPKGTVTEFPPIDADDLVLTDTWTGTTDTPWPATWTTPTEDDPA